MRTCDAAQQFVDWRSDRNDADVYTYTYICIYVFVHIYICAPVAPPRSSSNGVPTETTRTGSRYGKLTRLTCFFERPVRSDKLNHTWRACRAV